MRVSLLLVAVIAMLLTVLLLLLLVFPQAGDLLLRKKDRDAQQTGLVIRYIYKDSRKETVPTTSPPNRPPDWIITAPEGGPYIQALSKGEVKREIERVEMWAISGSLLLQPIIELSACQAAGEFLRLLSERKYDQLQSLLAPRLRGSAEIDRFISDYESNISVFRKTKEAKLFCSLVEMGSSHKPHIADVVYASYAINGINCNNPRSAMIARYRVNCSSV